MPICSCMHAYVSVCVSLCVCLSVFVCFHIPHHVCGSQRTTCRSRFFLSTTWGLGLELRSWDLAASTFAQGAVSPDPEFHNRYAKIFKSTYLSFSQLIPCLIIYVKGKYVYQVIRYNTVCNNEHSRNDSMCSENRLAKDTLIHWQEQEPVAPQVCCYTAITQNLRQCL